MLFLIHFPAAFSNAFLALLRCMKIVLPHPKNTKQAKTLTFIRLPFACSLPASLRFLQRPSPVLYRLRCAFCNGFRLFPSTSCLCFFPAICFSIALFFFCFLFSLPYKIMHTIPPLLSFTIFCMVSCSFIWHSSSIIEILPRMPSSISSPMDFPKILVSQAPSSLFSPSLM